MGSQDRSKAKPWEIAAIFLGIAAAMASYEFFNNLKPLGEPLVMNGWLDDRLPIVPVFVVPYLSFHPLAMIVVPLISLRVGGRKAFIVNGLAIITSQIALDVAYFFFQTKVPRVPITTTDPFSWILTNVVYGNDEPLNGFPSNHVTWTVISIIALWRMRKAIPRTSTWMISWFALILPATVLLRQHFLIDIYGGIFVAFTAYWVCVFMIEQPDVSIRQ